MSKQIVKQTIDDNIYQNGQQRITGSVMNSVLKEMVDDYAEQSEVTELASEIYGNETETISITLIPTSGKYIAAGGGVATASFGYISNVVHLHKGEVVEFVAKGTKGVGMISSPTSDTSKYNVLVPGANDTSSVELNTLTYTASEDIDVVFSYFTSYTSVKITRLVKGGIKGDLEDLSAAIEGNAIYAEYTATTGTYRQDTPYDGKEGTTIPIKITSMGAIIGYTIITDSTNATIGSFSSLPLNGSVELSVTLPRDTTLIRIYTQNVTTSGKYTIQLGVYGVKDELRDLSSNFSRLDTKVKNYSRNYDNTLTYTGTGYDISQPLKEGDTLTIVKNDKNSCQVYGKANGAYISLGIIGSATTEMQFAINQDFDSFRLFYNANVEHSVHWYVRGEIAEIKSDINKIETRLDGIKYDDKLNIFRGLFRKVLCIGDSVTHGLVSDYPNTKYNTNLVSYPRFLQQLSGWTITNAGHSSWNADEWYNNWRNNYTYTDYDMALMEFGYNGDLTDTLNTDCPLAAQWVGGTSYSVGAYVTYNHLRYKCVTANSDASFTPSKWTPAYSEYANTHTGYYCKVIETILNANPSLLFVLIISPRFKAANINNIVIKKIAQRYGLLVVDLSRTDVMDLNETKYHGFLNAETKSSGTYDLTHFNLVGYAFKASLIYHYLEEAFNENLALINLNTEERYFVTTDAGYNKEYIGFLNQ